MKRKIEKDRAVNNRILAHMKGKSGNPWGKKTSGGDSLHSALVKAHNYAIRKILAQDNSNMPADHESDGVVALYCMMWTMGLVTDANVPAP